MKRPKHTPQTLAALKARRFTGDETSVPESPFASTLTASDREKREMYERAERANSSRVAGAAAFRRGRDFQKEVRLSIESYNTLGRAAITEVNVKTAGPMNALTFSEPATVDFIGLGRFQPVAFDAKVHSGRAAVPVEHDYKNRQRQIRQLQFLRAFRRQGGLAFLLVHCDDLGLTWVVQDFDALLGDPDGNAYAPVPLRTLVRADRSGRAQRCISHHPVVREASVGDLSKALPRWPFLDALDPLKIGPDYRAPSIDEIAAREF